MIAGRRTPRPRLLARLLARWAAPPSAPLAVAAALGLLLSSAAQAAAPGVSAPTLAADVASWSDGLSPLDRLDEVCTRLALAPWPSVPAVRRQWLQRLDTSRAACIEHAPFLATLGGLWLEEGEPNQAVIWLERALLLDPGHLGAQADLALALAALGQGDALRALQEQWRHRTDIPPALRARLAAREVRPGDPLPVVKLGGATPTSGWAQYREASVLLGHETNLDQSPRLAELTLTPPGGPIDLPLLNPLVPRRGTAALADLSWQLARSPAAGRVVRLGMNLGARGAPNDSSTDWQTVQMVASLSQTWAPWRVQADASGSWVGGPLSEPYRVGRLGLSVERQFNGCTLRSALDAEARAQSDTRVQDGRTLGLSTSAQCGLWGTTQWTWGLALRGAVDRPVDPERAGGVQRLWSAGLRLQGGLSQDVRLELTARVTRIRDDDGYNPLLEDNARRRLNQAQLGLELSRPVRLPGGRAADVLVQVQAVRQQSNLSLFAYNNFSTYAGLRWAW